MKTFTKRHIWFYIFSIICGLKLLFVGIEADGNVGFLFFIGIFIIFLAIIGILFFRKGEE